MPGGNPEQPVRTDAPSVRSIDLTTLALKFNEGLPKPIDYEFGGRRRFTEGLDQRLAYAEEVAADSPLAWWRLGESSGSAIDAIGGLNGTYGGGATLAVEGVLGDNTAVQFSGASGGVCQTADHAALALGKVDFTMEAWLKHTTRKFSSVVTWRRASSPTNASIQCIFTIGRFQPGDISCETWAWNTEGTRCRTRERFNDGKFHHVVATYVAATDLLSLYVDTRLKDQRSQIGASFSAAAACMTLGRNVSDIQHYPGVIDEVAIYASALSQARIEAHFMANRGNE